MIRIAVTDDHTLFRKILSDYLSQQANIQIPIQAENSTELLYKLKYSAVDVLIMDLFMPNGDTFETILTIYKEYPNIKIIILSVCTDLQIISGLVELGIYAYLSKAEEPEKLVQAISAAWQNKIYRNALLTNALFFGKEGDKKKQKPGAGITLNKREKQIIQFLWEEKTNKEISQSLYLSVRSVEKIRQDIKDKVGHKSIAGLFRYALDHGIIVIRMSLRGAPDPQAFQEESAV